MYRNFTSLIKIKAKAEAKAEAKAKVKAKVLYLIYSISISWVMLQCFLSSNLNLILHRGSHLLVHSCHCLIKNLKPVMPCFD